MRRALAWPLGALGRPTRAVLGAAAAHGWDAFFLDARPSSPEVVPVANPLFEVAAMVGAGDGSLGELGIGLCSPMPVDLHPLRLAEELGVLDLMTGGGFEWVVPFDRARAFAERLEIVVRAGRGEPFAYDGAEFSFGELRVVPAPLGEHRPRIWLEGASRQPAAPSSPEVGRLVSVDGPGIAAREALEGQAAALAVQSRFDPARPDELAGLCAMAEERGAALLVVRLADADPRCLADAARALGLG